MNLYKETINDLAYYGRTEKDIRWIGNGTGYFDMTGIGLKDIFDIEYDAGFGAVKIDESLIIVGDDWWLERHEYDGSEWWEFKTLPIKPDHAAKEIDIYDRW